MYVQSVKQTKLNNVNNTKQVALSFKDPREKGRVLTIDVEKSTFQQLLKNFSKNNFLLSGDGSVKLEGEAAKFISNWWESIAYKAKKQKDDKLSIRGFRDIESPYIKQNYIKFGLVNKQYNNILKMFREDGKSLKTDWIGKGSTLSSIENSDSLKEFKSNKKEIDEKIERIPTVGFLYFRQKF